MSASAHPAKPWHQARSLQHFSGDGATLLGEVISVTKRVRPLDVMPCCQVLLAMRGENPPMALGAEIIPTAGAITDGAGAGTGTDAKPAASSAHDILLDNLLQSLLHVLLLQPDSLRRLTGCMAGIDHIMTQECLSYVSSYLQGPAGTGSVLCAEWPSDAHDDLQGES